MTEYLYPISGETEEQRHATQINAYLDDQGITDPAVRQAEFEKLMNELHPHLRPEDVRRPPFPELLENDTF